MDVERRPAARLAFLFQWMLGSSSVVIKSKPISTEDVELDYSYEVHQRENARQVLRQLALGVDPRSGCAVAQNPLLQDPGVIRALFLAIEALTDHEVPTPPDTREKHLHRAGLPWSEEEDEQLGSSSPSESISKSSRKCTIGRRERLLRVWCISS
jgi:hypothetical protein